MNYYNLCCQHRGKLVTIRDRAGKIHRGRITRVTRSHVYLSPSGGRGLGGYGWGYYGAGYGYGYAVPLAFIAGFALGGLLWW